MAGGGAGLAAVRRLGARVVGAWERGSHVHTAHPRPAVIAACMRAGAPAAGFRFFDIMQAMGVKVGRPHCLAAACVPACFFGSLHAMQLVAGALAPALDAC